MCHAKVVEYAGKYMTENADCPQKHPKRVYPTLRVNALVGVELAGGCGGRRLSIVHPWPELSRSPWFKQIYKRKWEDTDSPHWTYLFCWLYSKSVRMFYIYIFFIKTFFCLFFKHTFVRKCTYFYKFSTAGYLHKCTLKAN